MSERKENMNGSEDEEGKNGKLTWSNSYSFIEALATIWEECQQRCDINDAQVPAKSPPEIVEPYRTLLDHDSGEGSAKTTQEKQPRELVTRDQDEQNATQKSQEMTQDEDATRNNAEADDHAEPTK